MTRMPLPSIKRFRDFRAYGVDGTRYLDLWQADGRAFWGHTPRGLSQVVKNAVSPGLYGAFPHPHFSRIQKRVRKLFPGWEPWVFPQVSGIVDWLKGLGFPALESVFQLVHPLQWEGVGNGNVRARTIRPGIHDPFTFTLEQDSSQDYSILIPQLPLPADWMGNLVLVKEDQSKELFDSLIGQSSQVSGIQVATLIWLLDHLLRIPSGWRPWVSGQGLAPPTPTLDFPGFSRIGRYLVPQIDMKTYTHLYTRAKHQGILLNPRIFQDVPGISILPAYGSHGEWANISQVLAHAGLEDGSSGEIHE